MSTYPTTPFYHYRCENLRAADLATEHIKTLLKKAIASSDSKQEQTFTRLYSLLLAVWSEARLKKLQKEWNAFSPLELEQVNGVNNRATQYDRWVNIINLSYSKHYSIPVGDLNATSLGTNFLVYSNLLKIMTDDLKPIIEMRNKLAHGEWIFTFNNNGTALNNDYKMILDNENYLSLKYKQSLIQYFSDIIHDLVISKPTFDRDFAKTYKKITDTKSRMVKGKSFGEFSRKLQDGYNEGKQSKQLNIFQLMLKKFSKKTRKALKS